MPQNLDPARVVIMGSSVCGHYRAHIALERRYAAGVTSAALYWDLVTWQRENKRCHENTKLFSLADVVGWSACPFLIVHSEDDIVVPVESVRKLYEAVDPSKRHPRTFTAADGATLYAQADNRPVAVDDIADWISGTPRQPVDHARI